MRSLDAGNQRSRSATSFEKGVWESPKAARSEELIVVLLAIRGDASACLVEQRFRGVEGDVHRGGWGRVAPRRASAMRVALRGSTGWAA